MPKTNRRKRHRILGLVAAVAVALVVVLVVVLVWVWQKSPDTPPPSALPPASAPPGGIPPTGKKPRPEFQDASCPDVQAISIPGTWESWPTDDPFNPTQFPNSLMLKTTNPLRAQFG